jgi:hypothetical protein
LEVNNLNRIDTIESKSFQFDLKEIQEKKALLHKEFGSRVVPENGIFGETIRVKDNGVVEKLSKTPDGHYHKEYWAEGKLFQEQANVRWFHYFEVFVRSIVLQTTNGGSRIIKSYPFFCQKLDDKFLVEGFLVW